MRRVEKIPINMKKALIRRAGFIEVLFEKVKANCPIMAPSLPEAAEIPYAVER